MLCVLLLVDLWVVHTLTFVGMIGFTFESRWAVGPSSIILTTGLSTPVLGVTLPSVEISMTMPSV